MGRVYDVFCKVRFLLKSALWGNIAFFVWSLARILMYHSESIGRREREGAADGYTNHRPHLGFLELLMVFTAWYFIFYSFLP